MLSKTLSILLVSILFLANCNMTTTQEKTKAIVISNTIEQTREWWESTADFELPMTVIYGGAKVNSEKILQKGFSHIALSSALRPVRPFIKPEQRAILWTGIAYENKESSWAKEKSPWNNNLPQLKKKWSRRINGYSEHYGESPTDFSADIITLDIEADLKRKKILNLKTSQNTPKHLQVLSDEAFIDAYHNDIVKLSCEPIIHLRNQINFQPKLSSYGDVPVTRTWYDIEKYSWQQWTSNPKMTDYLGSAGNEFADNLDFISPSAYFLFNKGENLAYCLFQIEANKAWSEKPLTLFLTPRYVGKGIYGKPIPGQLAEAMAIFPFFSGADGLWFWESAKKRKILTDDVRPVYERFQKGLFRLSEYKTFFTGDFELVIPKSAREHFVDKDVVWRGVIKGNKILVAAQNPFASQNEKTNILLEYKNFKKEIELNGKEILLQVFELRKQNQ